MFRGHKVLDADYRERHVEIAFRPRDGRFAVTDAAIRKDAEWIPNISELWASGRPSRKIVNGFIDQLGTRTRLSEQEEDLIAHSLDRLFGLQKYPFTALEIAPSVDEEEVADIFVRINSEGVKLNQADFILTLLSVLWEEGRAALERFCQMARRAPAPGSAASPFNHFIEPDPDQLLRVAVALGFGRGRLKSVYQILRGKDPETGELTPERREAQLDVLRGAQARVLDLGHWHQFLAALVGAGFRGAEMISSQNALLYGYALYLIGRTRHGAPDHALRRTIGRWFFASSLTGRYTNSPESAIEGDLNRLKEAADAESFVRLLEEMIASELANDYWTITLPAALATSSARNPQLFAFIAAQNRLGAPVLFSHREVGELLDPALRTRRKAIERHHLFPRAWLERQGVDARTAVNQMANYALVEWPDNVEISDEAPSVYLPRIRKEFTDEAQWRAMCRLHALPEGWEGLDYDSFLARRRVLMAGIIREGFETLAPAGPLR